MNRFEAQQTLFANAPTRAALQALNIDSRIRITRNVNVWRNHAIEPIISLAEPYFRYGEWHVKFTLSDYDDTLSFSESNAADLEIIWINSERYINSTSVDDWIFWLISRLTTLRKSSKAPILICTWLSTNEDSDQLTEAIKRVPACYFADLRASCGYADLPLLDSRTLAISGTPLNPKLHAIIARELACRWMPACLLPPIKAIAIDLDNTLHAGILGEDGQDKVKIDKRHIQLQQQLCELQERGIFLALVSRNEESDVKALFANRFDYPLRWEHFTVKEVSWGEKSAAIARIADALRIGLDSILFVDDNPGEVLSVVSKFPAIHTILADAEAELTGQAIANYPALWRWSIDESDKKRVFDLEANAEREHMFKVAETTESYISSLCVKLIIHVNPIDQLKRLSDLCIKTNQFNLALRRFSEAEVAERISCNNRCVVSVSLSDKLSDSGVIAVIIAEQHGCKLIVEELCISCRAMGRQLENSIIFMAIRAMPQFQECDEVVFRVNHGPRNQPAQGWLAKVLSLASLPGSGLYSLNLSTINEFNIPDGLVISIS
jgi:FkbH-like protein